MPTSPLLDDDLANDQDNQVIPFAWRSVQGFRRGFYSLVLVMLIFLFFGNKDTLPEWQIGVGVLLLGYGFISSTLGLVWGLKSLGRGEKERIKQVLGVGGNAVIALVLGLVTASNIVDIWRIFFK